MNFKFVGNTLRKVQWGRDFLARILKLHRLDMEIWRLEKLRRIQSQTYNHKGVRSYVINTYSLAIKMTRYNELKFWFMKTKYPYTKSIK